MTENFANTYQTTLASAVTTTSGTSISVSSAVGAPTVNFRIKIDSELMLVTGVSGTTFTVTRGIEGSTAATHSNGAPVTHVLTAAGLVQGITDRAGGWTQDVTESGASLANWTSVSGTWSSDGTIIQQTGTGAQRRLRYDILLPNYAVVMEAEVRFPSAGQTTDSDQNLGVLIGWDGSSSGSILGRLHLNNGGSPTVEIESDSSAGRVSVSGSFAYDQWHAVRLISMGGFASIYLDGTFIGAAGILTGLNVAHYVGLFCSNCLGDFRNIKHWKLNGP